MTSLTFVLSLLVLMASCAPPQTAAGESKAASKMKSKETGRSEMIQKITKSDEEWKKILTPEEYPVARKKGTERAFTGRYWDNKEKGMYQCVACALDLFSSETKYDSGTGWPSFWKPVSPDHIKTKSDRGFFTERTEVLCARCDSHLGHVFEDGPAPTGQRFCINSVSLKFIQK